MLVYFINCNHYTQYHSPFPHRFWDSTVSWSPYIRNMAENSRKWSSSLSNPGNWETLRESLHVHNEWYRQEQTPQVYVAQQVNIGLNHNYFLLYFICWKFSVMYRELKFLTGQKFDWKTINYTENGWMSEIVWIYTGQHNIFKSASLPSFIPQFHPIPALPVKQIQYVYHVRNIMWGLLHDAKDSECQR